ncbi:MAG: hypothetical protein WC453_01795 [Patescibacteria group bacterium]
MKLDIKFGIDFEKKRVKETLVELNWCYANGYTPILPKLIGLESSEEEINNQIDKEYNRERYQEIKNQIINDFLTIHKPLVEKLKETINKDIPSVFQVYLTNYGTNGSYFPPNIIVVNINSQKGYKTIVHEIIHLLIEDWIQKYNVSHWEKERTVDSICNSEEFSFLHYNDWKSNYYGVEKYIDNLFHDYFFKDPENFFSKIENVRPIV